MFRKLKYRSMLKTLPFLFLMLAFSIGAQVVVDFRSYQFFVQPIPLEELDLNSDIEGKYVTIELDSLQIGYVDFKAVRKDRERYVAREYLMQVGDHYMGVLLEKKMFGKAAQLLLQQAGLANGMHETVRITGTIRRMSELELTYFHRAVGYDSMSEEAQKLVHPYFVHHGKIGYHEKPFLAGYGIASIIFFLLAITPFLRAALGIYQRGVRAYLKKCPDPEDTEKRMGEWIMANKPLRNICYIGTEWLVYYSGCKTEVLDASEIVWVYMDVISSKWFWIHRGSRAYVRVRTKDKGSYKFGVPSIIETSIIIDTISDTMGWVVTGHSSELDEWFNKDSDRFKEWAVVRREELNREKEKREARKAERIAENN